MLNGKKEGKEIPANDCQREGIIGKISDEKELRKWNL